MFGTLSVPSSQVGGCEKHGWKVACIYMGTGLVAKWNGPIGERDRVGVVRVHSRL
jgi:hypothetical protein